jgi:hypothetical protein
MRNVWEDMWEIYRKMRLSEDEINERILCKTTKVVEGKEGLGECDK